MLLEISGDRRVFLLKRADSRVSLLDLLESLYQNFFGYAQITEILHFYCVEINYCLVVDLSIAVHEFFHLGVYQ